jgi:hypothetical protein
MRRGRPSFSRAGRYQLKGANRALRWRPLLGPLARFGRSGSGAREKRVVKTLTAATGVIGLGQNWSPHGIQHRDIVLFVGA